MRQSRYGLPTHVREYSGANGQTLVRLNVTDYHLESDYVNRRIIGLPYQKTLYDGQTGALMSKVQYYFDWDAGGDMFQDTPAAAVQHDRTYINPSSPTGRGNLSDMIQYDVINDPNNTSGTAHETKFRYSSTGSLLMRRDASGHATYFDYTDKFSENPINRNTFAYPTTFTDGDNIPATTEYKYDFGAVTRTLSPTSGTGGTVNNLDMRREYDGYARLEFIRIWNNQTYTHFVYDPNDNYVHTYETIIGSTQADEFHSWQVFDGAGRVRANAADHPGGTGLYSGSYVIYDNMGRVIQESNPNEMNGSWSPSSWALVGEDPVWRVTQQTYDWKGRPLQTTNTDGTTKVITYGGCGCAGGEVTTVQDEHGRQKRYTKDTLGRLKTVDELNWNGSAYATTNYSYDALDHMTRIDQAGQTPRTFDYDGYGRLWRRTTPEQGQTTYSYYADDTVNVITDARGATTTHGYDGRHHVTSLAYGSYGGASPTANVSFLYDAGGNRFWMADGQGYGSYSYDDLGRMTSEGRYFTSLGWYYQNYGYNAGGELTSITNNWNTAQVGYGYDKAGRLTSVSGSGYAGVSNYANNISYRAFGAIKGMNYGDSKSLSAAYDTRLRTTMMNVSGVLGYKYYYDDFNEHTGRVTFAQDISQWDSSLNRTQTASPLDRSYEYDNLGRLVFTHSGAEARAHAWTGQWGTQDGPYSQDYSYDVWGNMTERHGWGGEVQQGSPTQSTIFNYTYTNNRRTDSSFTYDAAGNLTFDGGQTFTYDVTGQQTYASYMSVSQDYDGDGLRVKKTENSVTTYYLRSSVLGGQVVAELTWSTANNTWLFNRGYVYMGSQLLAVQNDGAVYWMHEDPITKSKRVTNSSGGLVSTIELDPWGADTGVSSGAAFQPKKFTSYHRDDNGTDEAMFRRYNRWHSRFDQPDPSDESYAFDDPQSLNRYAYVQGDPANLVDPTGTRCIDGFEIWVTPTHYIPICLRSDDFGGGLGELKMGGGKGKPQKPDPKVVDLVNRTLSTEDCQNFMKTILNNASTGHNRVLEGGDIQKMFGDFLAQKNGGISRERLTKFGTATGKIGTKGKGNGIIAIPLYPDPQPSQNWLDASGIVNELPHIAGSKGGWPDHNEYDDYALAQAVHASKYDTQSSFSGSKNPFTAGVTDRADPRWSNYFHDILRKNCVVPR
jgi:RHS repeat-associated protein